MDAVLVVAGAALILLVAIDIFFTVLFPASGHGPIRRPVEWTLWQVFRRLGRMLPRKRRPSLLAYAGPAQILATILVWLGLLLVGWAMIYKPGLGDGIQAASGPIEQSWWTALYFSGFNLTTLGTGDLAASDDLYRLMTVIESATGFAVMTMVLTYFLSTYSTLPGRNAFALKLHQLSLGTDDAATLLSVLLQDGAVGTRQHLDAAADSIREISQTHRAYPVLRHFHYQASYFALPRMMLTCLETTTLIRSALAPDRYPELLGSSAVHQLAQSSITLTQTLVGDISSHSPASPQQDRAWRSRYREATETLSKAGVYVRTDPGGEDDYVVQRAQWDAPVAGLADQMLHDWSTHEKAAPGVA